MKIQCVCVLTILQIFAVCFTPSTMAKESTWTGYLLDKQCAESVIEDSNPISFIQHHTKDCALMQNCRAAGYGLYSKRSWYNLDKHGNQLAIKTLQASKRNSGFYVQIIGEQHGKTLQVKSMKEIDEPKAEHGSEKQ